MEGFSHQANEFSSQFGTLLSSASSLSQVKSLLLLMLGLTFLKDVAAGKNFKAWNAAFPKPDSCPPMEGGNFVKLDIRIVSENHRVPVGGNFQNRSSSPWDYSVNWDPNRFPSEITQAQCRYLGCVDAQGKEDVSMNSVPIQQEMLVLRRKRQGCSVFFQLEKVMVTVGCTCVTPMVHRLS
ncbi:PREDICTED: interleukin-17F-like [Propithecus coquereli]|uniref:interleukin-17F-like n=1 Tax=Propithecus coquereli TaxID=379532 RepID=UPI00063FA756|nr:PREDICTED: interleukin-17F-like [Propithecus coquereli]